MPPMVGKAYWRIIQDEIEAQVDLAEDAVVASIYYQDAHEVTVLDWYTCRSNLSGTENSRDRGSKAVTCVQVNIPRATERI